jgi:heat-inducible transcriptional repressor
VDHLLHDTVRLLARVTQHVSVAATVRESGVTIRQVTINGLTPQRALMVVVLSNADVEDHMIEASPELTLSDLQTVGQVLTTAVEGRTLRQLLRQAPPAGANLKPAAANLLSRSWRAVKAVARSKSSGKLLSEGTAYLLSQPEFQRDFGALTEVVQALEDANVLHSALDGSAGLAVTIGRENSQDALKRLAVIAARFHVGGEDAGAIAVIGPTRMDYDRAIPLVEQTAKALSEALTRLMR